MKRNTLWITRTAIFIALLIVMQAVTAPLGNTIVTGSIVNMLLIISVMTCGLSTGITVAILSSILAKLFGIGPLWSLIPFIILGNLVLITIWYLIGKRSKLKPTIAFVVAWVTAAVVKFSVLYLGIVKLAIPVLLKLPEPQASVVSGIFSVPQLFTALIGGGLALIVLPLLRRAVPGI